MEYVLHMHGIWNMPGVYMETLVSVNPLAQNPNSLLPPSHEITSSLQHSGPKTEPRKIPLEQLCFSVFFFGEYTRPAPDACGPHTPAHDNIPLSLACFCRAFDFK